MNTQAWKSAAGGRMARSVLECGSPLPLSAGDRISAASKSARGLAQSKTWRRFVALFALAGLPLASASAQNYSIDWSKIAGGGGTSTGGVYSAIGTIGQSDASGALSGGQYSVVGGFWSFIAGPTPGAPLLTIRGTSTNAVLVTWP